MKQFAEKLIKRSYKKRMLAILIAAATLLAVIAVLIPATLHRQISEFRALEKAQESEEASASVGENGEPNQEKKHSREQELKAVLKQLTPVGRGIKIAFAAVALLAFLLGAFYWITVAEWLYKAAVLQGLNRALWPILGLMFNIFAIPALLIVLCDPKRMEKQVS